MEEISFVLIGFWAGTLGTIIGIGGGLLIIPVLLLCYNFSSQQAAGTSLLVVFFNSLSGTFAYAKQKRIDYKSAGIFALATLPGTIGGGFLNEHFSDQAFRTVFGLFMVLIALYIFFQGEKKAYQERNSLLKSKLSLGIIISFFVGFLSSTLGLGGGIIHVPTMIYLLDFAPHIATATSQAILCFSAFWGFLTYFFLGNINFPAALFLGLGTVFGAQAGAFLSKRMKAVLIIKILALVLVLAGIRLIFTQ